MENILKIISAPDNVAIVVMLVLVGLSVLVAFYLGVQNDRRIAGKAEMEPGWQEKEEKVQVWPFLARKEFLVAVIIT
ncbi:MAG: hypothetical protein HY314_04595, partial [Acidobacteria bacterium]|nr:hypothetical protein [Acidobacteriota bacterium]